MTSTEVICDAIRASKTRLRGLGPHSHAVIRYPLQDNKAVEAQLQVGTPIRPGSDGGFDDEELDALTAMLIRKAEENEKNINLIGNFGKVEFHILPGPKLGRIRLEITR